MFLSRSPSKASRAILDSVRVEGGKKGTKREQEEEEGKAFGQVGRRGLELSMSCLGLERRGELKDMTDCRRVRVQGQCLSPSQLGHSEQKKGGFL